jgi:PAS domain-containing protein
MRDKNGSQNNQQGALNPLGWAIVRFTQRTRGGGTTQKLAWVKMRYQTFLQGRRGALARASGVTYLLWQPNRDEKLASRANQYWKGVPRDQDVQYDPKQFAEYPTSPEEKQNIVERLKELHRQLRERLQTRKGKMSPETHELAKQMTEAQGELVLNIEQGTGIGDQQTAEEYARMLATYGVVVVDGIVSGLSTDEIAKRLFGYTEEKTKHTPSILGNYFVNSEMHHAALDELNETGTSSVPLLVTETARSAEGHLFLQGLAELIDRVQNGEELAPELRDHVCEHLEALATEEDRGVEEAIGYHHNDIRRYAEDFYRYWLRGQNGNPPVAVERKVVCPDGREYTFYDWNTEYNEQNQLVGHPTVAEFFAYNNNYARGAFMPKGAGNVVGDPLGGLRVQAAMARHLLECNPEQSDAEDLSVAVEHTALELMPFLNRLKNEASLPEDERAFTRFMLFRPAMPHVLSRLANLTAAAKFAEQNQLELSEGAKQKLDLLLNDYGLNDPNSHVYRTLDAMFTLSAGASPMMFQKGYTVAEKAFGGPDEPHVVYAADDSVKTLDDHLMVWSNFLESNSQQRGS